MIKIEKKHMDSQTDEFSNFQAQISMQLRNAFKTFFGSGQ